MVPSGIKRDGKEPFRTRRLDNGTVVVEDAYEGRYTYSSKQTVGTRIKGLKTGTLDSRRPSDK